LFGSDMNGTGSALCPMVHFGTSGAEPHF